jgi:AraC-like DNA-binding protein
MSHSVESHRGGDLSAGAARAGRIMLINPDRVVYAGLLGVTSTRKLGALTVYASLAKPFRICLGERGGRTAELAVVPPYTPHRIESEDRVIGVLMIEPESIDAARLPRFLQPAAADRAGILRRIRDSFFDLRHGDIRAGRETDELDRLFFGQTLERRALDRRIATVVDKVRRAPCEQFPAETCAQLAGLSLSRFLHLFKAEVGMTFRCFRAWKRARSFLSYVKLPNLTEVALQIGYPDSTHFSHSIRNVYGLTPTDIRAGSRRLAIVTH